MKKVLFLIVSAVLLTAQICFPQQTPKKAAEVQELKEDMMTEMFTHLRFDTLKYGEYRSTFSFVSDEEQALRKFVLPLSEHGYSVVKFLKLGEFWDLTVANNNDKLGLADFKDAFHQLNDLAKQNKIKPVVGMGVVSKKETPAKVKRPLE